MAHAPTEKVATLGTNKRLHLQENAYAISLGKKVEKNYIDGGKKILLIFTLIKHQVKIHKEIPVKNCKDQIKVIFIATEDFFNHFSEDIEKQKQKQIREEEDSN